MDKKVDFLSFLLYHYYEENNIRKEYLKNLNMNTYKVIADENELKWFFDHCINKPLIYESYLAVFVCRHKKLTEQEKESIGLSRKSAEFLNHQSFRLNKKQEWTFRNFLANLKKLEVNKEAFLTEKDEPLPEKTLVTLFYVNPSDDIKVGEKLVQEYNEINESILKAHLNGKTIEDCITAYRWFTNLSNRVKHLQANQKGTRYWLDYDIDVPKWFKEKEYESKNGLFSEKEYQEALFRLFTNTFGKGNYVVIDTSGGYHVLVRTTKIMSDPHKVCKKVEYIYNTGLMRGEEPYLDENGNCKFECTINDSQIPGIPLPGTYQYGRPVIVLNKEDFE